MKLVREITKAGNTFFIRTFAEKPKRKPGLARVPKCNPTPEAIQIMNDKNSARNLHMLLNENFKNGDYHVVLTYRDGALPSSPTEMQKNLQRFQRKANALYKKNECILKYVSASETDKRNHHHVIMTSGATTQGLQEIWPHGHLFIYPLYSNGDYRALADYIIKETSENFRKEDAVSKRRYNTSRTINRPKPKREEVKSKVFSSNISPPKGYYVDKDSFFEGVNPVTGQQYNEYVLLPIDGQKNYWKWARLKKTKAKPLEHIKWLEENGQYQLDFEALIPEAIF